MQEKQQIVLENTPTLETERLILRQFTQKDTADLYLILSDKEVNTFLPWYPIQSLEEAREYLERNYLLQYQLPGGYRYAVCLKADDKPIGYVHVGGGDSYDFGYGLMKEFWHKGIVAEAAAAVVNRIKKAGFPYITATHDVNNARSGRVMQKLGMTYRYSYVEQWQPKDIEVTFRLYQLNLDGNDGRVYMNYWNQYSNHFIEEIPCQL